MMMNGFVASILSIVLILTFLDNCQADYVLTVGSRVPGDKLIQRKEIEINKLNPKSLYTARTFTGDNKSIITQVVVTESKDGDYEGASIINGGPGHTFVTVLYEFNYARLKVGVIEIYGKSSDN